ncbi:ABC transporter ATP-binding protein [Rhodococcoides fascians]|uniref:ABC transporter ATP-binding protein n=1 Tax=Rhodococcoides fascians TaxID=1828 RepID=UPI0005626DF8|nr:ABC transporter ATP-binding protein [Rhodococcus fascians]
MTTTPAVHLEHLSKAFGKVQAVADVSLRVEPGEVVAFLGPNGAGKTTTIDMMLGLAKPDTGTARVFGRSPAEAIADGRVSAVMQSGGLIRDLSVRETIQLTASLFPRTSPVDSVLERAGITGIADRRVAKCSGGEQQRLRFALALLPEPDLILLDEPTTGMDVEGRRDFWNAIRHDARDGRTVMFATHYLDEADAYADRIVLLRHGRIVADGSAAEVKNLASGRTVTATARGVDQTALLRIPGVDHVEMRGERVIVHGKDSDAVARYLLTCTDAVDVEIVSKNLEDAFLALTTDLVGSAT